MNTRQTSVPAEAASLPVLTQFLQEFWSDVHLPADEALAVELALEEIFMNVVMHGAPDGYTPRVTVSLSLHDDDLTLDVEDDGPPFDPLSLAAPDPTISLEHRPVGGVGVPLVRHFMTSLRYRRRGLRNHLQMCKRVRTAQPPAGAGPRQ